MVNAKLNLGVLITLGIVCAGCAVAKVSQPAFSATAQRGYYANATQLARGEIFNDTTQRIDTRQLMGTIEEQLLNSGQAQITSAIGNATDSMLDASRELRNSEEFKKDTLAPKRAMIAPDLSFSGKIFERIVHYDRKTKQVEYYIELKATNIDTGLRFWQKQIQILKRSSIKTPLW